MNDLLTDEQRVTIVTVTYNSAAVVEEMLSSVPAGCRIIVVDNATQDLEALRAVTDEFGATLVENEHNKGFGVACHIGALQVDTEFVLFLNPDAILLPDTLAKFVEATVNYPDASGFNPRLEDHDGKPFFKRKSYILPRSKWMPRGWPKNDQIVSVLSGAAMFMTLDNYMKCGGFDPKIFLFHEDDDLALRLHAQCGPLMFIRDAIVQHGGGSSTTRSSEVAELKAWHMGHSRVYATRKHNMRFARTIAVVQSFLQAISPIVLFSARKRAKQFAFLRGVVHASLGQKSDMRIDQ